MPFMIEILITFASLFCLRPRTHVEGNRRADEKVDVPRGIYFGSLDGTLFNLVLIIDSMMMVKYPSLNFLLMLLKTSLFCSVTKL